jgi:hypothetical protein
LGDGTACFGAAGTIALVPNLVDAPEMLSLCIARSDAKRELDWPRIHELELLPGPVIPYDQLRLALKGR